MSVEVLQTQIQTNNPTLDDAVRDKLLENSNGGVAQLFDFGFGWCYPAGDLPRPAPTNPTSGDLIRDVAENADASVFGSGFTYSGGGVTKSKVDQSSNNYALVDTSGNLNGFTQSTNYLICSYLKVADLADFNSTGSIAVLVSACNSNAENYTNAVELVTVSTLPVDVFGGNGGFSARFQTSIGNVTRIDIEIPSGVNLYDDEIVQLSAWFDGSACYLRIKSESYDNTVSSAHAGNTEDVSNNSVSFDTSYGDFGGFSVPHKMYRCFLENTTVSGRDPVTVLDADFVRTISRGVFS